MDLTETSKDKRHLHTKADPSLAINEAQPAAIALEASNLAPLRGIQHKDNRGNIITDPDRSNPTRHRLERPLDTIRGFQDAIDGSYNRRASSYGQSGDRPESRGTGITAMTGMTGMNGGDGSRRNSYYPQGYPNNSSGPQGRGYQEGGYYGNGNRNSMNRPDSFIDQYGGLPPQFQGQGRGMRPNPRNNSDPMLYGGRNPQNVYPSHSYQQSYDTVGSGGSHQTEPWGNSTDPSSENSSVDRIQQTPKQGEQQVSDNYGLNGFGGNNLYQLDEYEPVQPGYGRNGQAQSGSSGLNRFESAPEARPIPPPKATRIPIKLDSPSNSSLTREMSKESGGKRKSWLKRRFSKKE